MRTTIEVTEEQRAKLLHLAARRGLKGFSALVRETLDEYLKAAESDSTRIKAALAVQGSLKGKEGGKLAAACQKLREMWR